MEKLFIYGASGHGKVVADIAKLNGYKVEFIDDGENEYLDFDTFLNRYKKANITLGIGDNHIRYKIYKKLKKEKIVGHITLIKGERSQLADMAAKYF